MDQFRAGGLAWTFAPVRPSSAYSLIPADCPGIYLLRADLQSVCVCVCVCVCVIGKRQADVHQNFAVLLPWSAFVTRNACLAMEDIAFIWVEPCDELLPMALSRNDGSLPRQEVKLKSRCAFSLLSFPPTEGKLAGW